MAIDTLYMLLFGLVMIVAIDNDAFLDAFSFDHKSSFLTFFMFVLVYTRTVDIPVRILMNFINRFQEYQADNYSVK